MPRSRLAPLLAACACALTLAAPLLQPPVRAQGAAPALAADTARLHYHRPRADYEGWGLHAWDGAARETEWNAALPPTGRTEFGVYWDVPLQPAAKRLGLIVHKGDQKDPGPDLFLDLGSMKEAYLVSGRSELAASPPDVAVLRFGDLSRARAHWVERDLLLWPAPIPADAAVRLHHSPTAALRVTTNGVTGGESAPLTVDPGGVPASVRERFPHLAGATALRLGSADAAKADTWLREQLSVSMVSADGGSGDATGVQIPGVLDALFAYEGELGVTWAGGAPRVRLWAPTAQRVRLLVFEGPRTPKPVETVEMTREQGTWTCTGPATWRERYYLYEVTVFTPSTGRIETVRVTDPYSRSLSRDGGRTQFADLSAPAATPESWASLTKPPLAAIEDASVYELHVRDFSASDASVPVALRGTYRAFTLESNGTRHLKALAEAGLTHVHLLPVFDLATVPEDRASWASPGDLSKWPPDSEQQQAAVARVRSRDGFNWGYDPVHYGVPEGSYATSPDGLARIAEFREMVAGLSRLGLRVVMDVVYNHTHASGLAGQSVLDRIVPGYYQRLNADGVVENSTCCANTASEHRMMEKLIVDDVVHWARDHKVDGFRFDLMGHHMKANMVRVRAALDALTPERDGIDGSRILLYGEGWDFGEVQGGKRGANATQKQLAGTGIATFNDRLRDAVRGGGPFSDRREQGFATGLFFVPGAFHLGGEPDRVKLLDHADRIRVGLAGNLAGYRLTDRRGLVVTGAAVGGAGYTASPRECVNYVEAHDNETLWDKIQYAVPGSVTLAQRVRMQLLALSIPALSQGLPFFHAGGEILRTKSLDADSYDSGDWFNRVDFSHRTNHWGMGLPIAEKNQERWPIIGPLIADRALAPSAAGIEAAFGTFRDFLRIRASSPLFRLHSAEDVQARVTFLNTGPRQTPGLIAMALSDAAEGRPALGSKWSRIVVVFNASPEEARFAYPAFAQMALTLHPVQASGADEVVKQARHDRATASLVVPGLTTAVFVSE